MSISDEILNDIRHLLDDDGDDASLHERLSALLERHTAFRNLRARMQDADSKVTVLRTRVDAMLAELRIRSRDTTMSPVERIHYYEAADAFSTELRSMLSRFKGSLPPEPPRVFLESRIERSEAIAEALVELLRDASGTASGEAGDFIDATVSSIVTDTVAP